MNFPACVVPGFEGSLNELIIEDLKIVSSNPFHSTDDYNRSRKKNKTKLESCKICHLSNICNGIYPLYIDEFGGKEFTPIKF